MEDKPNNSKVILIVLAVLALAALLVYYFVKNLNDVSSTDNSDIALGSPEAQNSPVATQSAEPAGELKKEDLVIGTGAEAKSGSKVTVHYVGTLLDGTKFDSSRDRGAPFAFTLGTGEVIKGWDLGVAGMKVGGKRKLTIPSDLAYGAYGSPPVIGPNATIVFEVELLEVK